MPSSAKRLVTFDLLKFFAIWLVIFGHCIMVFLSGDFLAEPGYTIIYSFHMPLFMTIVGFFSWRVGEKSFGEMVRHKGRQLLLPLVFFCGLLTIITYLDKGYMEHPLGSYYREFWFLKNAFLCCVLWWFATAWGRKWIWAGAILTIVIATSEDAFRLMLERTGLDWMIITRHLGLGRMYPCFILGVLLHKYYPFVRKHYVSIGLVSLLVWVVMLVGEFYGIRGLAPVGHPLRIWGFHYQLLLGFVGTAFCICLAEASTPVLEHKWPRLTSWASRIGQETLGIYILQCFIVEKWLCRYDFLKFDWMNPWLFNLIFVPVISLLICMVCYGIIGILKKNSYVAWFLLGKPFPRRESSHVISNA